MHAQVEKTIQGAEATAMEKKYTSSMEKPLHESQLDRYEFLVRSLYCSFCDSHVLVNSTSPLALDLKRHILGLIAQGKSDEQIGEHINKTYGGSLIYGDAPLSNTDTYGPIIVAIIALAAGTIITYKKRKQINT